MPRIVTDKLLEKIAKGDFQRIKLQGLQNGAFYLLLESADGIFIHENGDGNIKEYPQANHALTWLKRMTKVKEVVIDLKQWQNDVKRK